MVYSKNDKKLKIRTKAEPRLSERGFYFRLIRQILKEKPHFFEPGRPPGDASASLPSIRKAEGTRSWLKTSNRSLSIRNRRADPSRGTHRLHSRRPKRCPDGALRVGVRQKLIDSEKRSARAQGHLAYQRLPGDFPARRSRQFCSRTTWREVAQATQSAQSESV